jgi:hypothetical protein
MEECIVDAWIVRSLRREGRWDGTHEARIPTASDQNGMGEDRSRGNY